MRVGVDSAQSQNVFNNSSWHKRGFEIGANYRVTHRGVRNTLSWRVGGGWGWKSFWDYRQHLVMVLKTISSNPLQGLHQRLFIHNTQNQACTFNPSLLGGYTYRLWGHWNAISNTNIIVSNGWNIELSSYSCQLSKFWACWCRNSLALWVKRNKALLRVS